MTSAPCCGAARIFNDRLARRELRAYRRKGPRKTTRWLLDALRAQGVGGRSLLDVGGGVGALQHEFVAAGGAATTDVDAAPAYLAAAREEAERRGYGDRASYVEGDFVQAAERVALADFVTLDRVVCCYPDADALLGRAAERARRAVGLVWPRDRFLWRLGRGLANTVMRLARNPFRLYVHRNARVDGALRTCGFRRAQHRRTVLWQVALYVREEPTA